MKRNKACCMKGCGRKHLARRLCARHYRAKNYPRRKAKILAQQRAARKANPEKFRARDRMRQPQRREAMRAWRKKNGHKIYQYNKTWRAKNYEKWLKYRGLPVPPYGCPSHCECCSRPRTARLFDIDHCHKTGAFRGWLCNHCNRGLGLLGDTAASLRRALHYLTVTARRVHDRPGIRSNPHRRGKKCQSKKRLLN